MNNLEMDIKKTLNLLYNNDSKDQIFVIDSKIVTKDELIQYLEYKLLTLINKRILGVEYV